MTLLVDAAAWPWRGRRWAHLCSDRSLEELHAFAAGLGVRRIAFQGDHYDIDAEQRAGAVAAGAVPVDARELVRRLRDSGLRGARRHGAYTWRNLGVFASTSALLEPALRSLGPRLSPQVVDAVLGSVDVLVGHHAPQQWDARVLHRPTELALLWRAAGARPGTVPGAPVPPLVAPVTAVWSMAADPVDRPVVELFAPLAPGG